MYLNRKSNSINAGDLKDLCTLYEPFSIPDGRGGSRTSFLTYGQVWCKAIPKRSSRALQEAQVVFNEALEFTIRYGIPIKANWELEFNGRRYIIHSVDDIENRYQYYSVLAYTKAL